MAWTDEGASISDPTGVGARIFFQQVPEGTVAKNRVHLDIHAGGDRSDPHEERWARILAAAEGLTAAGATLIHQDVWQGRPHHLVMADPEGNEFCLC